MKIINFFLFKIFSLAKTQDQSVGEYFAFFWLLCLFEMFHLAIIALLARIIFSFDCELSFFHTIITFIALGTINYITLIKNKKIELVYEDYSYKYSGMKFNLLFLLYMIILFSVFVIEGKIYRMLHPFEFGNG